MIRIGHKGAALLAPPGNTLASFDAAVECGVDMIEFDVIEEGGLYVAHDPGDLARRRDSALTLGAALDHLAASGVRLHVDLKGVGYEERVMDALRERNLLERSIFSTMELPSLATLRRLEPAARIGWTVPKTKRNPLAHPVTRQAARVGAAALRRRLPRQLSAALRAGRVDAIFAHWAIVDRRVANAVLGAGGELYVWTVDDAAKIAELVSLGVTGVITNDPRLFNEGGTTPR